LQPEQRKRRTFLLLSFGGKCRCAAFVACLIVQVNLTVP
jgi:hypothetical protein